MTNTSAAGDRIPPKCSVIEVHVGELKQLLDAIDPSPFRDRDLDPKAEEFIVGWAKHFPRSLALVIDLDCEAGLSDEAAVLRDQIQSSSGIVRLRCSYTTGGPIRHGAGLSDRLAAMPVHIRYANVGPNAWRADWPAVSPRGEQRLSSKLTFDSFSVPESGNCSAAPAHNLCYIGIAWPSISIQTQDEGTVR